MQLFTGRPADVRLEKEMRVYDLLEDLGIEFCRVDHEPAMTMEICQAIEGTLGASICKNLLLCNRQETAFYMLLLPGAKNFRTSVLSKEIGSSRLSFASGAHMEEFLDITPGSLSIFGLMNDKEGRVQLLMDEDVLKEAYLGCHPCINTSSLRIAMEDVTEKLIPALGHPVTVVKLPWQIA